MRGVHAVLTTEGSILIPYGRRVVLTAIRSIFVKYRFRVVGVSDFSEECILVILGNQCCTFHDITEFLRMRARQQGQEGNDEDECDLHSGAAEPVVIVVPNVRGTGLPAPGRQAWVGKMYGLPPARAKLPAVGTPVDRGLSVTALLPRPVQRLVAGRSGMCRKAANWQPAPS